MYNRYVPQPDGSHHRNRMPDPAPAKNEPQIAPPETPRHPPRESPVGGFLRQLLPKNFDTADLIIVLLLLLMAGDRPEEKNNALLTLALYFFL
jgi:hypothetical protein